MDTMGTTTRELPLDTRIRLLNTHRLERSSFPLLTVLSSHKWKEETRHDGTGRKGIAWTAVHQSAAKAQRDPTHDCEKMTSLGCPLLLFLLLSLPSICLQVILRYLNDKKSVEDMRSKVEVSLASSSPASASPSSTQPTQAASGNPSTIAATTITDSTASAAAANANSATAEIERKLHGSGGCCGCCACSLVSSESSIERVLEYKTWPRTLPAPTHICGGRWQCAI